MTTQATEIAAILSQQTVPSAGVDAARAADVAVSTELTPEELDAVRGAYGDFYPQER